MKPVVTFLFAAILLVGSGSALALDEVEALLFGESANRDASAADATVTEPQTVIAPAELGVEEPRGESYNSTVSLNVPAASVAHEVDDEGPSGFGITAVPEPSAIALAVLAFLYFLVFGRRRYFA